MLDIYQLTFSMFGCVWHQNGSVAKQSTTSMALVLREYLINLRMKSDHVKHEIQVRANISLYFILGFNVESASHFERLGAFGWGTYHWKGVDERFRTVVRTCL